MVLLQKHRILFYLMMGLLLTLIYPIQELFSGNQNVYFLWVMAELNPLAFAADPLTNSPDPYPVFTWLLSLVSFEKLSLLTSAIYWLLNVVYVFAFFGIADTSGKIFRHSSRFILFSILFLFLHTSPIWGTYSKLIFDLDFRWIWDSGIAEQGVLRGYLQPSVFGVFLLLSFHFALKEKYELAVLAIIPAAIVHANYVFLGGMLTILYVFASRFDKKTLTASLVSLLALAPYLLHLNTHFINLDASVQTSVAEAVAKVYSENIHINPKNWLNGKFYLQLLVLASAILLLTKRHRRLFVGVLLVAISVSTAAYITNSSLLISLNPWRLSIILVPAAVAVLTSFATNTVRSSLLKLTPTLILTVSVGLVSFRLLGNGTKDFQVIWITLQALTLVCSFIGFYAIRKWAPKLELSAIFISTVMSLLVVGLVDFKIEKTSKNATDQFQVINSISKDDSNTIYIIPPEWTSFRMNASKSVFADKNLVYGPALPGIVQRIDIVNAAYESGNFELVLNQIPKSHAVKLIARNQQLTARYFSSKAITEQYSCFVLRQ